MDAAGATTTLLSTVYPYLVTGAVAMARALGVVLITPAFTRLGITGIIRSCAALAIAIPVAPQIFAALETAQLTSAVIAGLVIKEMVVGLVVGIAFGIPFWAAEAAGDLVDLQRGSTASQLLDPLAFVEASITGTLLTIALVALFFMTGGFSQLIGGLYASYNLWPALSFTPILGASSIVPLLQVLDRIMQTAVLLLAPVVIGLLLTDIALGFLSRMAPQLHVFDLSLSVKNLLFSFLLVVYAAFMVPVLLAEVGALHQTVDRLRLLAEGASR
jgi:type III secretion protein T